VSLVALRATREGGKQAASLAVLRGAQPGGGSGCCDATRRNAQRCQHDCTPMGKGSFNSENQKHKLAINPDARRTARRRWSASHRTGRADSGHAGCCIDVGWLGCLALLALAWAAGPCAAAQVAVTASVVPRTVSKPRRRLRCRFGQRHRARLVESTATYRCAATIRVLPVQLRPRTAGRTVQLGGGAQSIALAMTHRTASSVQAARRDMLRIRVLSTNWCARAA